MQITDNKITIKTVAEKLNLSPATVSLVLSGQARERGVAKNTALRVRKVAEELNYVPNHWAQRLRNQKSGVISIIVPDLRYDFAQSLMQGIQPFLKRHNYIPFLATHEWDKTREEEEMHSAISRRDEGILCMPFVGSEELYKKVYESKIPLVFMADSIMGVENIPSVRWDSYRATTRAMEYLISKGRKRIGFVGFKHMTVGHIERFEAYQKMIEKHGLELNKEWIYWAESSAPPVISKTAIASMFNISGEAPDALLVINDSVAYPLLEILAELKVKVPEDVAVFGMCDLPMSCMHGAMLSSIKEPLEDIGRTAADVLISLINKGSLKVMDQKIQGEDIKPRNTA